MEAEKIEESPQEEWLIVDKLNREIQSLNCKIEELEKEKLTLLSVIRGVEGSLSWKVTHPLRAFKKFKDKLFPIISFEKIEFSLSPSTNTDVQGKELLILGPSPEFKISNSKDPSHGIYLLQGELLTESPHLHFLLHYRIGENFREFDRAWVTFVDGVPLEVPFLLPPGIKEFKLVPIHNSGTAQLQKTLTLKKLGSVQAFSKLTKRALGPALKNPSMLPKKLRSAWLLFKSGGINAIKHKLGSRAASSDYQEWVTRYDTLSDEDERLIKQKVESLSFKPFFSVLMPTYNTEEKWLCAAINSVLNQLYLNFELIIIDDASTNSRVRDIIREYEQKDSRVKSVFRKENGHIAKATDDGLKIATGEFIIPVDHDDEIPPHALYRFAHEINEYPNTKFIYSDEDKITEQNVRFNPYFKTDFDSEFLLSQNYICHLCCFNRELALKVGGYREGTDGAQDWDIILRMTRECIPEEIRHIPEILYHWRVIATSTASGTGSKPYVLNAQKKVIEDHLSVLNIVAKVEIDEKLSHMQVTYELPEELPLVSIIIPTKDNVSVLRTFVNGLLYETSYPNKEIIIVNNGSEKEETLEYFKLLKSKGVIILDDPRPFNFSRLNNFAVTKAKGSLLAFCNNDLSVTNGGWLREMVSVALQPKVGAVGARLLFPVGLLQHAGVILGIGGVGGHCHKGRPKHDVGYFNRTVLRHGVSAVTAACLVIKKEIFDSVGGFDDKDLSVAFNDVDFCIKVREAGFKNIYTPFAELLHHESISRGYENTKEKFNRFEKEIAVMKKRWGSILEKDPFYSPNLSNIAEDYTFAFPPRVKKVWRM